MPKLIDITSSRNKLDTEVVILDKLKNFTIKKIQKKLHLGQSSQVINK